jgi:superfamily II DNA or RNA helicase
VIEVVQQQSQRVLASYRVDPGLIPEHANGERRISQGGYGDRQIYELVQNGADELRHDSGGEIAVVLTKTHLYCANQGTPLTPDGADTILRMGVSRKRGGQIGRFGVGIKSVLSVTDSPEFYSRGADGTRFGFGFDRDRSEKEIRHVAPDVPETPVLRMAWPLDVTDSTLQDPILGDLLTWATTVARLPLRAEATERLGQDLTDFPIEFPLFSPHVGTISLQDRRFAPPRHRILSHRVDKNRHILQDETSPDGTDSQAEWYVFTRTHRPSNTALKAAGELHDRPEISVSWAVPASSRARGLFWAYFPTNYATTLRGILNAPWKTSEDRQNLFDNNDFNTELLQVASDLVIDSLPDLSITDDPASYIDLLPGRGREAPQWADEQLTNMIWRAAAVKPSLPNQDGVLVTPNDLNVHPEGLDSRWLTLWETSTGRPRDWCHSSIESRERRARVNRILELANQAPSGVVDWLEALTTTRSPEGSSTAIKIVSGMYHAGHSLAQEATSAKIVLTTDGDLVAPVRGKVFQPTSNDDLPDSMTCVDPAVLEDLSTVSALKELGIQEADALGRLAALVDVGFDGYTSSQWTALWSLTRQCGTDHATQAFKRLDNPLTTLKVRTKKNEYRSAFRCLLPGRVVPRDGSRDAHLAVDLDVHADDLKTFRDLGMSDAPRPGIDPSNEPWFERYSDIAYQAYCERLGPTASRPQREKVTTTGSRLPGPLFLLEELSPEGRAHFLSAMPESALGKEWTVRHGSNVENQLAIQSPLQWMSRKHGYLRTSRGLRTVDLAVAPDLGQHREILPVAAVSQVLATALRLPAELPVVPKAIWESVHDEIARNEDAAFAGRAYSLMLEADADWPDDLRTFCQVGQEWAQRDDAEIAVTADSTIFDHLVTDQHPVLLAPTDAEARNMIEVWGMQDGSTLVENELRFVADSSPTPLYDRFPHLKIRFSQRYSDRNILHCRELEDVTRTPSGLKARPVTEALSGQSILICGADDDFETLQAVDRALNLSLGQQGCADVIDKMRHQEKAGRRPAIKGAKTEPEKILAMLGEEALRRGLPGGLVQIVEDIIGTQCDGRRIAELAIDAFGYGLLPHYRRDIPSEIEPPSRFSGGYEARAWASSLGLDPRHAGTATETPPQVETITGPEDLPQLHDYQHQLVANMYTELTRPTAGRAMLSLPTGAGKTRVATEAVIRVIREVGVRGPVLWIAQTEELCEQATQSWRFLWQKVGASGQLTISRLWSTNKVSEVTDNPHVVVATDAKLEKCLSDDSYAWLRDSALVIVDEAHSSYQRMTGILRDLEITHNKAQRPLIGLTATPYVGRDAERTRLLVQRYGEKRLDDGVFETTPIDELQSLEMLAQVEHRSLEGTRLELTEDELSRAELSYLPSSAEKRLGDDQLRTRRLLEAITSLPKDWPVLLFATSVEHAHVMAGLLNISQTSAAAVDGSTPKAQRQRRIDEFRNGDIQVLCNYGVLAQGFDAPATRAVVLARPTFSPNRYAQMIGRGLRGRKNGGKDTCLILDVQDNITNFDGQLSYTELESLWRRS